MKKLLAILLLAALSLTLFSCGAINKDGEVSVLWSDMDDEFLATVADALDRAMYIENINYTHYDAEGNDATLVTLAEDAIEGGAVALVVSTESVAVATEIADRAKAASIPVIFLCSSDLVSALCAEREGCYAVSMKEESLSTVLGEAVAADLLANYDKYDRNGDGKISYAAFGLSAVAVPVINEKLKAADKPELIADAVNVALPTAGIAATVDRIFDGYDGSGNEVNDTPVELILTDDDAYVAELLAALWKYELNYRKLTTHFLPLYTVGISAAAGDLLPDNVKDEERDAFSVMNTVDKGYVSAAALADDDALALTCAAMLRNLIREADSAVAGIDEALVDGRKVRIPYTVYGN